MKMKLKLRLIKNNQVVIEAIHKGLSAKYSVNTLGAKDHLRFDMLLLDVLPCRNLMLFCDRDHHAEEWFGKPGYLHRKFQEKLIKFAEKKLNRQ